jgi:hypothetical protein
MHIRDEILKEHSKKQTRKIAAYIGNDAAKFRELMELFFANEYRVTQRGAWIVNECTEKHPELIRPYLKKMLDYLATPGLHIAVKRNTMRILHYIEIPKSLLGRVATLSFEFFASPQEAIAVKAHSMMILEIVCTKEPALIPEFRLLFEQQLPFAPPAIVACGRKVFKQLEKIEKQNN